MEPADARDLTQNVSLFICWQAEKATVKYLKGIVENDMIVYVVDIYPIMYIFIHIVYDFVFILSMKLNNLFYTYTNEFI